MGNIYTNFFNPQTIPQTSPIPGENQVKNNAGGYVYEVTPLTSLMRFLIIGTVGGTYYVNERNITLNNLENIIDFIKKDGVTVVNTAIDISLSGRAAKNDPVLVVMALAATHGTPEVKKLVYDNIYKVCRTGTHIFHFCEMVNKMRKWSGGLRRGIANFYLNKKPDQLAVQLIKYRQRDGWTHRDVLRLCHAGSKDPVINSMFKWTVKKDDEPTYPLIQAFEKIQKMKEIDEAIPLIKQHKMTWEMVPTSFLTAKKLWETLLPEMPLTAMLRNLTKMAEKEMFTSNLCENTKHIVNKLNNREELKKQRVHPFQILLALKAFEKTENQPKNIKTALNDAFYASFDNVIPTGKNFLIGLDVSGSMSWSLITNTNISAAAGGAALAMLLLKTEPWCETMAFSSQLVKLPLSKNDSLEEVMKKTTGMNFGTTDCAQPMLYAIKNKLPVDVFIVITDSETYHGTIHPMEALKKYRQISGRKAKLIVIGMTATNFTIADPKDNGCLDVAGFDAGLGNVINSFVRE